MNYDERTTLNAWKRPQNARVAYLCSESFDGHSNLFNYIQGNQGGPFSEDFCRSLFLKLLNGLSSVFAMSFTHRSLNPANIRFDNSGQPKISDFYTAFETNYEGFALS